MAAGAISGCRMGRASSSNPVKGAHRFFNRVLAGAAVGAFSNRGVRAAGRPVLYFVGTYTRTESKGIYAFRLHPESGQSEALGLAAESQNPSFLAFHRTGRFLYAVNENNEYGEKPSGSISAFAVNDASGRLTALNQVASQGTGPAHCAVDQSGKWLAAAN